MGLVVGRCGLLVGCWGKIQQHSLLASSVKKQDSNALGCEVEQWRSWLWRQGSAEGRQFELGAMASWCLFLVVNVLVCSVLSSGLALGSPSSDVAVLHELLRKWKATARPDVFENWHLGEDADPCTERWNGVVCSRTKSVIHLHLNGANLSGGIPPAIGALEELIILDLSGNPLLSSSILREIGHLRHLTHLKLSDCNFSGKVPQEVYNLSGLEYLDLSGNPLHSMDQDVQDIVKVTRRQHSASFGHRRSLLQVNGRTPLPIFFTYIAVASVALVVIIIITVCVCRWRSVRKTRNDTLMTLAPPIADTSFQSRRIYASEENEGAEQTP